MNHLRDLLEAVGAGRIYSYSQYELGPNDAAHSAVAALLIKAKEAMCFWMGDAEKLTQFQAITELCRLPYQTCWFELELKGPQGVAYAGMLAYAVDGGSFEGQVWVRKQHGNWVLYGAVTADRFDAAKRAIHADGDDALWTVQLVEGVVRAFLSALHCKNVGREMHEPEARLAKARAKRGKAPLFSYWTLQLNRLESKGLSMGGTHASPRLHLRRGHPREYQKGKWTWVEAHAVGNKSAGVVHKEYSVGSLVDVQPDVGEVLPTAH